jgi:hypothetical protein
MALMDRTPIGKAGKARAAIKPLQVGSQIEVQLSDGGVREGRYNELRRSEVVINDQGVSLSEVTAVYHVTSQAHE